MIKNIEEDKVDGKILKNLINVEERNAEKQMGFIKSLRSSFKKCRVEIE